MVENLTVTVQKLHHHLAAATVDLVDATVQAHAVTQLAGDAVDILTAATGHRAPLWPVLKLHQTMVLAKA